MAGTLGDKGKCVLVDLNVDVTDDEYDNHMQNDQTSCDHGVEENRVDGLTVGEVMQMTFTTHEAAGEFYNNYTKYLGFSVRKDDLKCNKNKIPVSRRWVCSREGYRSPKHLDHSDRIREPRGLTRVGCNASFRVKFDNGSEQWVVKEFVQEHNHQLVTPRGVPFLRSHRRVKSPDREQTKALRSVGIQTSQVRDCLVQVAGGYHNVGFTMKDLYNDVATERRSQLQDGDAEGALNYFSGKKESDPMFYFKYSVHEDNSLNCLFWADSSSRLDYACFGNVLAFDTTYRTNAYKKPFVILAGVNNHNATSIFGCALLSDETVATYMWVLNTFLHAMEGKTPILVVTDGDKAMSGAIEQVLPNATHRLCRWHLTRNALSNISAENFVQQFKHCMCGRWSAEEFEDRWKALVDSFGLENNNWISEVYSKRSKWAESYLRGQFFAGIKSTQRCEGMNSYFNHFLKTRLRLFEFVRQYDRTLAKIRENDPNDGHDIQHTSPVTTTQL